jgi:aminoglycoside/choline kinase family phosphotransferase
MSNADRSVKKLDFIQQSDWKGARVTPLAGDASNRKYDRLYTADKSLILMDAAPELGEKIIPFIALTGWLREQGLNAPEIFSFDIQNGFMLLEDFGDNLFARCLRDNQASEQEIYVPALDVLVDLGQRPCPDHITGYGVDYTIPKYDQSIYDRESLLVLEWYEKATSNSSVDLTADFLTILKDACAPYVTGQTLCLRDFHAENLIWLPERHGNHRVGLLDYQDALCGIPEYDLVSLTEDARRDVSVETQKTLVTLFAQRCGRNLSDVEAACAVLGAQRNLKILGIFVRLYERDGKKTYLKYLQRVWSYLQYDLQHDSLTTLREWVNETLLPPDAYLAKTGL